MLQKKLCSVQRLLSVYRMLPSSVQALLKRNIRHEEATFVVSHFVAVTVSVETRLCLRKKAFQEFVCARRIDELASN